MSDETYIVKYTGNTLGKMQTEKWMGSIFEVVPHGPSFNVVSIILNNKGFKPENPTDISFYKYNARVLEPGEAKKYIFNDLHHHRLGDILIEKELFEI